MAASLTFDESAAEFVLQAFGRKIDDEGYVVNPNTGKREVSPEGDELRAEAFAGVERGSLLFLDDNFDSLVEHVKRRP